MEQFRQIGEAVGSVKTLMVFQDDIQVNQRQCCLLADMLECAYNTTAELMKQNLRYEEKNLKWKMVENPLRELLRVFKEGEMYIRFCLETKDFWAKAISMYQNSDCIEFHVYNLLSCFPIVIEAIEIAGEVSGFDHDEIQKKRIIYSLKYHKECKDPGVFSWKFGRQYLVSPELCNRISSVWDEDRWVLKNKVQEKKSWGRSSSKQEHRLADLLLSRLEPLPDTDKLLLPSSTLLGSKDYHIKRRLENATQYKEVQWLGESFCLRHFFGEIEPLISEISDELALTHPNIMHMFCGFTDDEKKECYLIMELMNRDLSSYIKEVLGPRKRVPFSLPAAIDLMLQVARGMEYLHSKKIPHGNLNPSNILVKVKSRYMEGYLHAKVSGFGISHNRKPQAENQNGPLSYIWHAPELLAEQEEPGNCGGFFKCSEKSDVYSYGMICFEVLTGKVPFDDSHLQGDKMSRNIRAGERPLFPFPLPKYMTSFTKKCWHSDPNQRPSFSSICRILRYITRFIVMNPELTQPEAPIPPLDYSDIDAGVLRSSSETLSVSQIPFQMFAYKVAEREKATASHHHRENSESGSDVSACGDEIIIGDDPPHSPSHDTKSVVSCPDILSKKHSPSIRTTVDIKLLKQKGTPRGRSVTSIRPPQMSRHGRAKRMNSESQLMVMSPRSHRTSGHMSDSDLP
ncbi:PREDICTED: light-sensor Protein kinase-like [Ipomoea nil]|uniref:light-sensor Protein kinase-like n=1 Tax=Ipomoea nil TaxID=35883 RepID=UPI000900B05F|nr:PREDICTED: light-sensor Protein kinase-like [Ipomoea nil]